MRIPIIIPICFIATACSPTPDSERPEEQNTPVIYQVEPDQRETQLPTQPTIAPSSPDVLSDQQRTQAKKTTHERIRRAEIANDSTPAAQHSTIIGYPGHPLKHYPLSIDQEQYQVFSNNPIQLVQQAPVSTFSIDVDTGSYANVRRMLMNGTQVTKDAVRVEEMINYFTYDYPAPEDLEQPFSLYTELAQAPWDEQQLLLHIGVQGYAMDTDQLPSANLVFLIDVSGSMNHKDKLPLLKSALKLLVNTMTKTDSISLVVYAGSAGIVLPPTSGDEKIKILNAIDRLSAGGSTNGGQGIALAYQQAMINFKPDSINRVILASDGDFNVGISDINQLKQFIAKQRKNNIQLTTLGFGTGNYNDAMMEQLADVGDGHYVYIDSLNEARKVLIEEKASTLKTIAHDVKIQIEFNPSVVEEYRLIGYENRLLKREDFNNDKVDAGDIGAGHSVTALYQIKLVNSGQSMIDPLRYQRKNNTDEIKALSSELAFLKLRYKLPGNTNSLLISQAINNDASLNTKPTSDRFRFAAAVSAFGQLLRGGQYVSNFDWNNTLSLAQSAKGVDPFGYRSEFINLIRLAQAIEPQLSTR